MRVVAVQCGDVHLAGGLGLAHGGQLALGQVEHDMDRMDLGQRHQRRAGADDVAGVDRADTGDAGDRGGHAGVLQLHLGRAHAGFVGGHGTFELGHLVALGVQVGLGHVLAVLGGVGALVVGARGGQLGLVLALGRGGFIEAGLQGARVDLGEQVALLDFLAFLEVDTDQLAADLRADGDGVHRRHGSQRAGIDRHVLAGGIDHRHRDRPGVAFLALLAALARAGGGGAGLTLLATAEHAHTDEAHHQHCDHQHHDLPETRHSTNS
ncbi:hypothetical protein D3C71_1124650 [compost metagenome]